MDITSEARHETLKLLSEEGSNQIDRMYDRVNTVRSKNDSILALNVTIISIVIAIAFYSADNKWFPSWHLWILIFLYFVWAILSATYCIRMILPKEYAELALYSDRDFGIVSKAEPIEALGHIIYAKKKVFDALDKKYQEDMMLHRSGIGWFIGSLFGLFTFFLIEVFNIIT